MLARQIAVAAVIGVVLVVAGGAQAAIVKVAAYALGEAGSVGTAANDYAPLVDSIGGNDIPKFNRHDARITTAIETSGLVAPGSTAGLEISGNQNLSGTWYGSSFNGGIGFSDNWGMNLWIRPDLDDGSYAGTTDGTGGAARNGLLFWATNNTMGGTSLGGKTVNTGTEHLLLRTSTDEFIGADSSTYTVGQWYRVSIITQNGTVRYYLDQVLQDTATPTGHLLNDIRLGAGYWAVSSTNAAFDEMGVWTFAADDPLYRIENAVLGMPIPEPSTFLIWALGLLGLAWYARRRRRK